MDAIHAIYARRSVRQYEDRAVSWVIVDTLMKAAMAAPSAVNAQPWEFIVTDDEQQLSAIKLACEYGQYNAPMAIVVCGNMKLALQGANREYWIQDCSAATENILVAAASLGLGSVWLGVYPNQARVHSLQKSFDMPEHIIPLCVVYIGYPEEQPEPRTQYDEKRIHKHRYVEQQ